MLLLIMIYQIADSNIPYKEEKINTVIYSEISYFEKNKHDPFSYFKYGDFYNIDELPPDIHVNLESRVDFNRNDNKDNENNKNNKNDHNNNIVNNNNQTKNNTINNNSITSLANNSSKLHLVNSQNNINKNQNSRLEAETINIRNNRQNIEVEILPNQVGAGEGQNRKNESNKLDKVDNKLPSHSSDKILPKVKSDFDKILLAYNESKLVNLQKYSSNKDIKINFDNELNKAKEVNVNTTSLFSSKQDKQDNNLNKQKSSFSPNSNRLSQNYFKTDNYFKALINDSKKSKFPRKAELKDDMSSINNNISQFPSTKINAFNDRSLNNSEESNPQKDSESSSNYESSVQISSFVYTEESIEEKEIKENPVSKLKVRRAQKSIIKIVEEGENNFHLKMNNFDEIDNAGSKNSKNSQVSKQNLVPKRGVSEGPLSAIINSREERKIDYSSINKINNKTNNNRKTNTNNNTFYSDNSIQDFNPNKLYEKEDYSNSNNDIDTSYDINSKSNFPINSRKSQQSSVRRSNSLDNINITENDQIKNNFYDNEIDDIYNLNRVQQIKGRPVESMNIIGDDGVERIIEPEKHEHSEEKDKTEMDVFDMNNEDATILDFEELPIELRIKYDYRTFWKYLKDIICNEHQIISLFTKKSLFFPAYIRIIKTFTYIFCYITIGTMLYSDDDISAKNKLDLQPAVL